MSPKSEKAVLAAPPAVGAGTPSRLGLGDLALSAGKRARLHRLAYGYGAGNGTLLILPIDQGFEHGPIDFFPNPPAGDPAYQFKLALEGEYSGIAVHIGLAEKYLGEYAGRVPLILKINGRTNVPPETAAFSACDATVEDAVRLGADAVGYTLYVGSPAQDTDLSQCARVRAECERFGMPLILWGYPRGEFIEVKGGRNTLYAIAYAARVACEMGADVVKVNIPERLDPQSEALARYRAYLEAHDGEAYLELEKASDAERLGHVVTSAGRTLVLISGGGRVSVDKLTEGARTCMDAGATGLIFGRNLWQRPREEALALTQRLRELLAQYPR